MKGLWLLIGFVLLVVSCEQPIEKVRGITAEAKVKTEAPNLQSRANELNKKGYKTFLYEEGDTTYLMQQYFISKQRNQPLTGFSHSGRTSKATYGAS